MKIAGVLHSATFCTMDRTLVDWYKYGARGMVQLHDLHIDAARNGHHLENDICLDNILVRWMLYFYSNVIERSSI